MTLFFSQMDVFDMLVQVCGGAKVTLALMARIQGTGNQVVALQYKILG
jgi:hypothetical protein